MPECYEVTLIVHSACQFTVVVKGNLSATPLKAPMVECTSTAAITLLQLGRQTPKHALNG